MTGGLRIGIDFDNTIITYDDVFLSTARDRRLIGANFSGRKQAIRDAIRLQPDGELSWQKLQGHVYGRGLAQAAMSKGADSFLRRCRAENVPVMIVSHKTEFGHYDPERLNLRDAAREWMTKYEFFSDAGYGIAPANVYFEGTRQDKVARIAQLGCTHFIDDLEEVLSDPEFPSGVERILFTQERPAPGPYFVCPTWRDIEKQVFRAVR
ncbi:MAG TPA: hypothetical protein VEU75_03515 [Candidatus Acidoferrum sp.]|nr:hypothetical protein [Candidatus Acidoferrum sp.]